MKFTPKQKQLTAMQVINFLDKNDAWRHENVMIFTDHKCYVSQCIESWTYKYTTGFANKEVKYICYEDVNVNDYATYGEEDTFTIFHEGGIAEMMMMEGSKPLLKYLDKRLAKYGLEMVSQFCWYSTAMKLD